MSYWVSDRPGTGDAYASKKLVYFGLDIHWEFDVQHYRDIDKIWKGKYFVG